MTNILLVAAHPDDETIGASTRLRDVSVLVHVTGGAPRDMTDAARCGFASREAYAAARRAELAAALRIAGASPSCLCFGVADQEAALAISEVAQWLRQILRQVRPEAILTHAYEGGHPDHDACSAAVRLAAETIPVFEFTGYHNSQGGIRTGDFLASETEIETVVLNEDERELKRRMTECFHTQRDMLRYFGIGQERFRRAPRYDYTRPPHDGTLFYEQFPWGMTGARFRELAADALAGRSRAWHRPNSVVLKKQC